VSVQVFTPTVQEVEEGTLTTYPHLDNAQYFFPKYEEGVFITTDQVPADQRRGNGTVVSVCESSGSSCNTCLPVCHAWMFVCIYVVCA